MMDFSCYKILPHTLTFYEKQRLYVAKSQLYVLMCNVSSEFDFGKLHDLKAEFLKISNTIWSCFWVICFMKVIKIERSGYRLTF